MLIRLAQHFGLARIGDEGAFLSGLRARIDLRSDGLRERRKAVLRARRDRDDGHLFLDILLQHLGRDDGCQVVLVEQQDGIAAAHELEDLFILAVERARCVEEREDQSSFLDIGARLLDADALDDVIRCADARRVDDAQRDAADVSVLFNGIARRARHIRDDGPLLAE